MDTLDINVILTEFTQSPPIIYHKLQKTLKNPDFSFNDLTEIIQSDANLTTRLLKLVNSPYYNLTTRIDTLSHAISVVGLDQLVDLALSTEVVSKFRDVKFPKFDAELFWIHCIACGIASRSIAAHRNDVNPESFYLAGLLHDIGRLVILKKLPKESEQVVVQSVKSKKPLSEVEKETFGFNHDEVGQILLEEWNLGERIVEGVEYHHNPLKAPRFKEEAATIHAADIVSVNMKLGNSGEGFVGSAKPGVLKLLQLDVEFLRSLRKEVQDNVNETAEILLN